VNAPSGTIVWRLPATRELTVLWQVTDSRSWALDLIAAKPAT